MKQFIQILESIRYDENKTFKEISTTYQLNSRKSNLLQFYYYLEIEDIPNAANYYSKLSEITENNESTELSTIQRIFFAVYKYLNHDPNDLIELSSQLESIKSSLNNYPELIEFIILYLEKYYTDYLLDAGYAKKVNTRLINLKNSICNNNGNRRCNILLINLGHSYTHLGDHINALKTLNKASKLIELQSNTDQLAMLEDCYGWYYASNLKDKLALEYFERSFERCNTKQHSFKLKFSILRIMIDIKMEFKEYDKCIAYAKLGRAESKKQLDQKWEFIFENLLAIIYLDLRKYDDALGLLEQEYDKYESSDFIHEKGAINFTLAKTHLAIKNYTKSDLYFIKSINYLEASSYATRTISYFLEYSSIEEERGKIDNAIEILNKAEFISKEIENHYFLVTTYFNMGRLLIAKGDLNAAKGLLTSNIELFIKINPDYFLPPVCYQLSEISRLTGNLKEAEIYNLKAFDIISSLEDDSEKARNFFQKGLITKDLGNTIEAEEYFIKSIELFQKGNDFKKLPSVYFELGLLKMSQGEFANIDLYLEDLKTIHLQYPTNENKVISLLMKAIYQSGQKRAKDKFMAQGRLETIIEMESVPFKYKIIALIQMSRLLIYEYQLEKDNTLLTNVEALLDELESIGIENSSYLLVVESYVLRSNLAQYRVEYQEANDYLLKARTLSEEKNFPFLMEKISKEEVNLSLEITRIDSALSKVTNLTGDARSKYFENYLKKMIDMVGRFEHVESDESKTSI